MIVRDCDRRLRIPSSVIVAVACLLQLSSAYGAKWSFDPNATASETYTDNVTLSNSADAESDWVTQINPGFSVSGAGRNLSLSLSYNLQNLFYAKDDSRNNSYQQLQSSLNAMLLPQLLFIDASASIGQQVLKSSDKVSTGNIAVVGNRTDVKTSSVSPYFRTRIGGELKTEIRYTYDRVTYSKSNSQNSTSNGVSMRIRPAHRPGSWSWGLDYQQRNIDYQNRSDEQREDTSANIIYQINPRLGVVGTGGYQNNKYSSSIYNPRGEYWNLNINWNPSSRTSLTLGGGERYYGRSWNLNLAHRARHNNWLLSYSEGISSLRVLQLESGIFRHNDAAGNVLLDPVTGLPVPDDRHDYYVSFDQVFLSKRANASWGIRMRKVQIGASVYSEQREYQDNGAEDRIEGSSLNGDWKMNRQNQFSAAASWQKNRRQTVSDNYQTFAISYRRQVNRHTTGDISLNRLQRTGVGTVSYTENKISAALSMSW